MTGEEKDKTKLECVCNLKWFNESKGFGFLVPQQSNDPSILNKDAFVHVSVFQEKGISYLGKDALLSCEAHASDKGLFIDKIIDLIDEGDVEAHKIKIPLAPDEGETYPLRGKVKWYRQDKGFGFVAGEDGKKDIFIHQTALRRNKLSEEDFIKDAPLQMSVRDVDQGREAVEIEFSNEFS